MGGSNSYGDLLFVFGKDSKSDGFNKKSAIALTGVIKFLSNDWADRSNLFRFLADTCGLKTEPVKLFTYHK